MTIRFRCPRLEGRSDRCPAHRLYSPLTEVQETELGRERVARHYLGGQTVFHCGTPALAVYSVHSGSVRLTRPEPGGEAVTVGLRGPGDLLGLREVLAGVPYQVSAETLRASVLCSVPRESFLEAVRASPEFASRLLARLAAHCLETEEQLVVRAHANVPARIARTLVIAARHEEALPGGEAEVVSMSREEIASLAGTTRETLSRSLHRLEGRGTIEIRRGAIRIRDRAALERLATA